MELDTRDRHFGIATSGSGCHLSKMERFACSSVHSSQSSSAAPSLANKYDNEASVDPQPTNLSHSEAIEVVNKLVVGEDCGYPLSDVKRTNQLISKYHARKKKLTSNIYKNFSFLCTMQTRGS